MEEKFDPAIEVKNAIEALHKTVQVLSAFIGISAPAPADENEIATHLPNIIRIVNGDNPPLEDVMISIWKMRDLMYVWANAPEPFRFFVGTGIAYLHDNSLVSLSVAAVILRHPDPAMRSDGNLAKQAIANGYKPHDRDLVYVNRIIEKNKLPVYIDPRIRNPQRARVVDVEHVLSIANGWDWRDE